MGRRALLALAALALLEREFKTGVVRHDLTGKLKRKEIGI